MFPTLEQEQQNPGRKRICRYLRKDGYRCTNEIAGPDDDDVLLCPKHLHEAWHQYVEAYSAWAEAVKS